ncbi:sulfite exporter TauE/SafE family protein [Acrocarpospora sp. B8E8]|uniref:sulfite exporter TauE/SafE family protein n=1 Tax=Acrocarpospora sp. B8E8 TaxID=3153572 RepID=UPI00325F6FFF
MSGWAVTVVALAIVVASCLQGSIGFGMGMVAAPVVAIVDPGLLPGMLIMLAVVLTLVVTLREREAVNLRGAGWALFGRVPGTVAGVWLVAVLPQRWLALLLGAAVLVGVVLAIGGWAPDPTRRTTAAAGAVSGLLGTATSIGGPPMALVWQSSSGAHPHATRGSRRSPPSCPRLAPCGPAPSHSREASPELPDLMFSRRCSGATSSRSRLISSA